MDRLVGGNTQEPHQSAYSSDNKVTPATLTFLRERKVGRLINLAPLEEDGGNMEGIVLQPWEGWEVDENGVPGPPSNVISLVSFLSSSHFSLLLSLVYISFAFPLSLFFLAEWGQGEGGAPL